MFGVLQGVLCCYQSTVWLGSARFSWGFSFFSVSQGDMLSNLKIKCVCYLCVFLGLSWEFSVVLSPLSVWFLQGSLGGSLYSVYQKVEMLSKLKILVFCYLRTFLGFSRRFSVALSPLSGWAHSASKHNRLRQ